jgi:serine/threonine protein kinase
VYGGTDASGAPVAIKVLTNATSDKKRRFKNEIAFLLHNKHANIVAVIDHGMAVSGTVSGPFYVMRRYKGSLRELMRERLAAPDILGFFSQILDGVEAAHLQGATHRDLKPENILFDERKTLAIADFGVASFNEQLLVTLVETAPTQRLANFQYAAPEQRSAGNQVSIAADIYALGLMLNEMFTGYVPHGTDYRLIASVSKDHVFLDGIVAQMIKQNPADRPASISNVKGLIQRYQAEAVSLQRLSAINDTVIKVGEIDEPLAFTTPVVIGVGWSSGVLRLTLSQAVTPAWLDAFYNMGSHTSIRGSEPQRFQFNGTTATVPAEERGAQLVIDHFKAWLPQTTLVLRQRLEAKPRQEEASRREQLNQQRRAEEQNLRVNSNLRI